MYFWSFMHLTMKIFNVHVYKIVLIQMLLLKNCRSSIGFFFIFEIYFSLNCFSDFERHQSFIGKHRRIDYVLNALWLMSQIILKLIYFQYEKISIDKISKGSTVYFDRFICFYWRNYR